MAENEIQIKDRRLWSAIFTVLYLIVLIGSVLILKNQGKFLRPVPVFDFIIIGIAVFRLIHLFVYDYIMDFIRNYFDQFQTGPGKTISDLLSCPWCTGIWMGLFVLFIYFLSVYAWYFILAVALAGVGTFVDVTARRIIR